jgi:hypothetical protein
MSHIADIDSVIPAGMLMKCPEVDDRVSKGSWLFVFVCALKEQVNNSPATLTTQSEQLNKLQVSVNALLKYFSIPQPSIRDFLFCYWKSQ